MFKKRARIAVQKCQNEEVNSIKKGAKFDGQAQILFVTTRLLDDTKSLSRSRGSTKEVRANSADGEAQFSREVIWIVEV
jgi:hypothetical protein